MIKDIQGERQAAGEATPDAEVAVLVITRLVGEYHPLLQARVLQVQPVTHVSVWTTVHNLHDAQTAAHPLNCANN